MDFAIGGFDAEIVGRAVNVATFDAASGHPHAVAFVVVPAAILRGHGALALTSAAISSSASIIFTEA